MSDLWNVLQLVDENGDVAFDFGESEPDAVVTDFDPGFPAVRAVSNNRVNGSGTVDTTKYFGSRGVTMTVSLDPAKPSQSLSWQKRLLQLCLPDRRPYLYLQTIEDPMVWRMLLVGSQVTAPYQVVLAPQLAWTNPDGTWEAAVETERTIFPGNGPTGGRTYPKTYPWSYSPGTPPGSGIIEVAGTVPTPPVIRIYGPVTGPAITNATTGQTIAFKSSYTVPSGGYVSINCNDLISPVLANDDPSLSRMNQINFTTNRFWFLQPGENQIQFTGTALGGITQAVISWRERTA